MDDIQISGRHARFIEMAATLAANKAIGEQRHGAIVVGGGRILGKGFNDESRGRHAEHSCLNKNWASEMKGAILYIARIRATQRFGMSRPCEQCLQLIREYGIRSIVYTTNNIENPIAMETWP
jgi:deoxycytidylate deaminase